MRLLATPGCASGIRTARTLCHTCCASMARWRLRATVCGRRCGRVRPPWSLVGLEFAPTSSLHQQLRRRGSWSRKQRLLRPPQPQVESSEAHLTICSAGLPKGAVTGNWPRQRGSIRTPSRAASGGTRGVCVSLKARGHVQVSFSSQVRDENRLPTTRTPYTFGFATACVRACAVAC